ncbi:MAG: RNA-binding transcriptional accessory protein, partial [Duncaniella sp.]|nr:RNA-binding transcriptional accessory protein [Duncaniella sp.]
MANVHANVITAELGSYLRKHVAACLRLLDEGATVPFIARYRKEATGGMDEVTVHAVQKRHQELTELDKRKEYILDVIKERNALSPELQERIMETLDPVVLEDIYLPYKPKRNTRAQAARALGLEPLARMIMAQNSRDIEKQSRKFAKEAGSINAAIAGASEMIGEWVNESE